MFRQRASNEELVQARQLSLRGADALQRSRDADAELLFSEALKHSPMDERAHWGYAATLWNRGDSQKAIEHMREALRLSGKNPEYAVRLGEMYLEVGDQKQARENAKSVLADNRNHAAAWALLGDTHAAEKDWAAAMECYQRSLLIQSDFPSVQLKLASIYRIIGKPERSLAVLDRMVDLHDSARVDPEALLTRGLALADLERNHEAAEVLAKASERLPVSRIDKQLQIVHAQHRIGELVSARMTLGRIRENHSDNVEVQRLQSMLDMSFAHLSDPIQSIEPSSSGSDHPMLMATPVSTTENWLRR